MKVRAAGVAQSNNGMTRSLISKLLLWLTVLLAGAGLVFLNLAVRRSMLPYNSEGNYFDGVVNYHEQSVAAYGLMAGASFLTAIMLFGVRLLVRHARHREQADRPASARPST